MTVACPQPRAGISPLIPRDGPLHIHQNVHTLFCNRLVDVDRSHLPILRPKRAACRLFRQRSRLLCLAFPSRNEGYHFSSIASVSSLRSASSETCIETTSRRAARRKTDQEDNEVASATSEWSGAERMAFTNRVLEDFLAVTMDSVSLDYPTSERGSPRYGAEGKAAHRRHHQRRTKSAAPQEETRRSSFTKLGSGGSGASVGGAGGSSRATDPYRNHKGSTRQPNRGNGERRTLEEDKDGDGGTTEGEEEETLGRQAIVVNHLLEGNFDEELLADMTTTTLNWSIATLGKYNKADVAEQLFHWMRLRQRANEHSLVQLFRAYERSNMTPRKALSTWHNVNRMNLSFVPGSLAASSLLKTFRPWGDVKGAQRVLRYLQAIGTPLNQYAYNIVIRIAADRGDAETALKLLTELVENAKGFASASNRRTGKIAGAIQPDARSFSAALSALETSKKWPRVVMVHKMMTESAVTLDATLGMQLITCYARCGRPHGVESVIDAMKDDGIRPNRSHWNGLLYAYAEARNYNGALKAYRRMTSGTGIKPDSYTLVAILSAASRAKIGPAAATWGLAIANRYSIPISVHLASAVLACCRHSSPDPSIKPKAGSSAAMAIVAEVLAALRAANVHPNVFVLNAAMAAYADVEDWNGVADVFNEIERNPDVEPDEHTWRIALRAFEKAGWWDRLENIEALQQTWYLLHGKSD